MKAKKGFYNILTSIISQVVVMVLGFIIPHLTLSNYGSEINGYMSSVNQIYGYIGLLEAGLATTAIQALYNPIVKKDKKEISCIINTSTLYYRKIAIIYMFVVILTGLILPFIIKSDINKSQMSLYFLLFGISNIINFWFIAGMSPLLVAEGKSYVKNNITLIFQIITQLTKILLLSLKVSIVQLQFVYSFISILQLIVYFFYFKKNYKWIDKCIPTNKKILKQRNSFFILQINNLVFSCTDVVIITIFCNLKVASIYAIYNLIFNSIGTLLSTINTSIQYILGQSYNENKEKYKKIHRLYETGLLLVAFILYTTACVLCIPFIKLYTLNVTDINYINYALPILFAISGLLATCKSTSLNLLNISFHVKDNINKTIIESLLNLSISIFLVQFMGIKGVLIGTIVALIFRLIDITYFVNKIILKISSINSIKLYTVNFLLFIIIIIFTSNINVNLVSFLDFIILAVKYFVMITCCFFVINIILNYPLLKYIYNRILKIRKKSK